MADAAAYLELATVELVCEHDMDRAGNRIMLERHPRFPARHAAVQLPLAIGLIQREALERFIAHRRDSPRSCHSLTPITVRAPIPARTGVRSISPIVARAVERLSEESGDDADSDPAADHAATRDSRPGAGPDAGRADRPRDRAPAAVARAAGGERRARGVFGGVAPRVPEGGALPDGAASAVRRVRVRHPHVLQGDGGGVARASGRGVESDALRVASVPDRVALAGAGA